MKSNKSTFWYVINQNLVADFGFGQQKAGCIWLPHYRANIEASIQCLRGIERCLLNYEKTVTGCNA